MARRCRDHLSKYTYHSLHQPRSLSVSSQLSDYSAFSDSAADYLRFASPVDEPISPSTYFHFNPVNFSAPPPPIFQRVDTLEYLEHFLIDQAPHVMASRIPGYFPNSDDEEPMSDIKMPLGTTLPIIQETTAPSTPSSETPFQWSSTETLGTPLPTIEEKYVLESALRESAELQVHLLKDLGSKLMIILETAGLTKGMDDGA